MWDAGTSNQSDSTDKIRTQRDKEKPEIFLLSDTSIKHPVKFYIKQEYLIFIGKSDHVV